MMDFRSSVVMMSGRDHGQPIPKHRALTAVRPEHFERWLDLFAETAYETGQPDVAALFVDRARAIAASLKRAMFKEDVP